MNVPSPQGLRVFSLNCRRSEEVVLSVLNTTDPRHWDVLCLQEPPIHIGDRPSFRSSYWNLLLPSTAGERDPSEHMRSVIYVSNRLQSDSYTQVPLKSLDLCTVQFSNTLSPLCLVSVYNPPSSVSSVSFLRSALRDPVFASSRLLLVGDFNLHHPLWSGTETPQRTRRSDADALLQVLTEHQLVLALRPGTPTYRSDAHGTWSTLDLAFVSHLVEDSVTRCDVGYGHGSDHCCLEVEFSSEPLLASSPPRQNWREADWEKYEWNVSQRWTEERIHQHFCKSIIALKFPYFQEQGQQDVLRPEAL